MKHLNSIIIYLLIGLLFVLYIGDYSHKMFPSDWFIVRELLQTNHQLVFYALYWITLYLSVTLATSILVLIVIKIVKMIRDRK